MKLLLIFSMIVSTMTAPTEGVGKPPCDKKTNVQTTIMPASVAEPSPPPQAPQQALTPSASPLLFGNEHELQCTTQASTKYDNSQKACGTSQTNNFDATLSFALCKSQASAWFFYETDLCFNRAGDVSCYLEAVFTAYSRCKVAYDSSQKTQNDISVFEACTMQIELKCSTSVK